MTIVMIMMMMLPPSLCQGLVVCANQDMFRYILIMVCLIDSVGM